MKIVCARRVLPIAPSQNAAQAVQILLAISFSAMKSIIASCTPHSQHHPNNSDRETRD